MEGNLRAIWGVLQGAAALELALEKALARAAGMAHVTHPGRRGVLLGDLLHSYPLEVPLVVGEAYEPAAQRVPHCLQETYRAANRPRTFVEEAPPCRWSRATWACRAGAR